jgi:hypothetical protein
MAKRDRSKVLGFPIRRGGMKARMAKSWIRWFKVSGFKDFRVIDYDKHGYKIGSLAHDCDGFNWRIAKIVPEYTTVSNSHGEVLCDFTFYKEDGSAFCHVMPPRTKEDIQNWWNGIDARRGTDQWAFADRYESLYGKNFTVADDGTVVRNKND